MNVNILINFLTTEWFYEHESDIMNTHNSFVLEFHKFNPKMAMFVNPKIMKDSSNHIFYFKRNPLI